MTVVTGPLCEVCRGISGHDPISGEGYAVCLPCVYRIGRATDPMTITQGEYHLIDQLHGDVVRLVWVNDRAEWKWSWDWPGVGDDSLVAA